MAEGEKIVQIDIEQEMKTAYIDYSMSVIVSRALPDVRDGMKPVHRRVLYGMHELSLGANKAFKKSARIVGEVLGKYHPHGDSSVYFAMVRMAQDWSMRYLLVDGQGNYGSIDGDSPAAMRYTEARLTRISEEILKDIEKETVDFQFNFDDSLEEPTVLPTRIPNLIINGSSGIAVGMATNMPPHNLTDTIDAIVAYIDNHDIEIGEIIKIIKAPDFPTGGIIYGYEGVRESYQTGRGRIVIRGKYHIETSASGRESIIFTEIPYMVNKAELIQKVADLVNEKKIEGIVYANDESDKSGMRIVFVLKKEAIANVVVNKLFKYTALQSAFSVNNIALVKGRPMMLNIKDLIHHFVDHRHDVVVRRTQFDLRKAEERAHILAGYLIALDHLDAVITLIREARTVDIAKEGLITNFNLTEIQATEILLLRLQRLTGLEREKIKSEFEEYMRLIAYYKEVLSDLSLRMKIIKEELLEIKEKFGDGRRTEIVYTSDEFNPEDFYADEPMVITISHLGYIKRTSLTEFRTQNRGGRGSKGSSTRDEDFIEHIYIATMHNTLLLFSRKGKCFWLKVYDIPEGTKISQGRAIQNLINIEQGDKIMAYINLTGSLEDTKYTDENQIVLCTQRGTIKKTSLEAYSRPRVSGIQAISVRDGDELLQAKLTNGTQEIIIASREGKAIRFNEETVRAMGRVASGVRAIKIDDNDEVIGMICVDADTKKEILVVSENGYGKRSSVEDYRITNRGGKGVKAMNITEKTGNLVAILDVSGEDDLMIINKSGITLRMPINSIRLMGRATQGVKLININGNDAIASVTKVDVEHFSDDETIVQVSDSETGSTEVETDHFDALDDI